MRKLFISISIAFAVAALASQANARPHPNPDAYIDVAAQPAYPESAARVRHSSAHALRRSRSRRYIPARHVDRKPPKREEAAPSAILTAAVDTGAKLVGALMGLPEGFADGIATPMPIIVGQRPERISGVLSIGTAAFRFVSGGAGWSIPYGDHLITPDDVGPWGARHGALGLDHDGCLYDRQLGRCREGVEIHADVGGRTAGCVGVERYAEAKRAILAMVAKFGRVFLHVWPGDVSVTPERAIGRPVIVLASAHRESPEKRRDVERHRREHRVTHRWRDPAPHRRYARA